MSDSSDLPGDDPIAWRAIARGTPVTDAEGNHVGTVDELLGSNEEDIFHGIVVRHHLIDMHKIAIGADDISSMSRNEIVTSLTAGEIAAMPRHTEERSFELGWVSVPCTYQYGGRRVITYETEPGWVKDR